MSQSAIKAEGLWKEYVVGHAAAQHGTFYDLLSHSLGAPLRRLRKLGGQTEEPDRFWAMRDVSFDIQPGEVVGVIGRNGAGKSTLLKMLSRITAPTKGRITVRGRLASLLEVGTGFHPELSGRENIFLNGAILGMSRGEVAKKFDEIVAFAEVEKFIDTPVKRYSSGMYVRLAFAVSAHLETDVLLIDEVLAVGDASFQRKSLGKMSDVAKTGRTVLFVSHNLGAIRNLCSKAMLFERGDLTFGGEVGEGLSRYERSFSRSTGLADHAHFQGPLADRIQFAGVSYLQGGVPVTVLDPRMELEIMLNGVASQHFPSLNLKVSLFRDGIEVTSCFDSSQDTPMAEGAFNSRFRIPANVFRPGIYTIGIGASGATGSWVWGADVAMLDFAENLGGLSADRNRGVVSIPYSAERIQ